jgi:PIN domain nuclease of toxin-antitoxin system
VILLDTHAAVWLANDDKALGEQSRTMALTANKENLLAVSAISFWEIALLGLKNRIELHSTPAALRRQLLDTGMLELPLTGDIALLAVELADLPGDPADRFIAATAIVHNAVLVTADAALLQSRRGMKRQDARK